MAAAAAAAAAATATEAEWENTVQSLELGPPGFCHNSDVGWLVGAQPE